jgi:hypothetical protein
LAGPGRARFQLPIGFDADLLIVERPDENGEQGLMPAEAALDIPQVRAVRVLKAGVTIIEEPRRVQVVAPSAEALREAARLGASLQVLSLDRDRDGKVVISRSRWNLIRTGISATRNRWAFLLDTFQPSGIPGAQELKREFPNHLESVKIPRRVSLWYLIGAGSRIATAV